MKRVFDIFVSLLLLAVTFPLMLLISLLIKGTSPGPVIYSSDRIGQDNKIFKMPKFRTMQINAPELATHLMENPKEFLTKPALFLRRSSLDELPQLFSILKGDMSLVGPRPALYNQDDLIELRTQRGINKIRPGLTGLAQINGRDDLPISVKVDFDYDYLIKESFFLDLKILWLTLFKVFKKDDISH